MGRVKRGWYERIEQKKVTLDTIKTNCRLTDREMELLQLVYDRKLVRRDQLEIISASYRNAGNNRSILLNRAITKLYRQMVFDKVHEAQVIGKGNTPCIVAIDKGGSILLGAPHKRRIIHKKTIYKGEEYINRILPSNYRHIYGVNRLEVETILFCEKNDFKIVEWQLEKSKLFTYNQEKENVIPDVLMILNIRGKPFVSFIEFDTGAEGLRQKEPVVIKEKIVKYKKYMKSNLWMQEEWQKQFPKPIFPMLLFVTEDAKRIDFFNRKSEENKIRGLGVYYENYTKFLERLAKMV